MGEQSTKNIRASIELGLKVIATCTALFGVGKYFYDLALERERTSKSASLAQITKLGSGAANEARRSLFEFWVKNAETVAVLQNTPVTPNAYENFLVPAFVAAENGDELFEGVYSLVQLYDDVFYCLDSGLCDSAMIEQFFCPKVTVTLRVYRPVVAELKQRSGYSNFAAGLEGLATRCEAISPI